MAEMVASAVVGETISRITSFVIDQPERKPSEKEKDDNERLEMAHIKMEAALHLSSKWPITEVPVLRWRGKLKRAAQECDNVLSHRKQRALEEEEMRQCSFPRRIARAAKSYVLSSFSSSSSKADVDDSNGSKADIRRFERFAKDASEFLKMVEFGGRQYMFFNPLIGDLLAGKRLLYQALQGGRVYTLRMRSTRFADRGVEALVWFDIRDLKQPAKSMNLRFMLRLSESSDILGIMTKCLRSATPHFMTAAEYARGELIQLPTQDFSRVSHTPYAETEYMVGVHSTLTHWFRPDPLCCNQHEHDHLATFGNSSNTKASSSSSSTSRLSSMYPEEVIVMHWQCYVQQSDEQKSQQLGTTENRRRKKRRSTPNLGSAPLKLELIFMPHDSPVNMEPAAESYALEVIDGKEQEIVYKDISLQDVDEKLLPKAMDHLCQNSQSSRYQMCLMSRHGTAHLCVEKTTTQSQGRNKMMDKKHEENVKEDTTEAAKDLLKFWVVHASDKLHGSVSSWIVNSP